MDSFTISIGLVYIDIAIFSYLFKSLDSYRVFHKRLVPFRLYFFLFFFPYGFFEELDAWKAYLFVYGVIKDFS